MRIRLFALIAAHLCLVAFAAVDDNTQAEIATTVQNVVNAVNIKDVEKMEANFSPEMTSTLRSQIKATILSQNITWKQDLSLFQTLPDGTVKVSGDFDAKGLNWSKKGPGIYFVLKKDSSGWKITDTNFHKFEFGLSHKGFVILPLIMLLLFLPIGGIFWIFMIIDCAKRPMSDPQKITWLVLLLIFTVMAAVVYYFAVKRGNPNPVT